MAVALLLAMSVAMMASASFAWVTLSRAPEVSGLATTVSTNGNLEIALSASNGLQPGETSIHDGSGRITSKNLTWGNLINLSDSSYGLDKIVLRPASLNVNELLTSPVQAVKYGSDGRINGYITDFAFTNYDSSLRTFGVSNPMKYGVRAVSSVTYQNITGNQFVVDQLDEIRRSYTQATVDFAQIYGNDEYMAVVGNLVQTHANVTLSGTDVDCAPQMPKLLELMTALQNVVDDIGQVYVNIANLEYYRSLTDITTYQEYTLAQLVAGQIPADYTQNCSHLDYYLDMYTRSKNVYDEIVKAAADAEQGKAVMWRTRLQSLADVLCDFDTATIHGYRVDQLIGNESAMLQVYLNQKTCKAVVVKGVLKDIDQFIDGEFFVNNGRVAVNVTYLGITVAATPSVETAAEAPFYLGGEIATAEQAATGGSNYKGDAIAAETYAMAIDLWVRTNIEDALLILEGELKTEEQIKRDEKGQIIYTEKLDESGNIVRDDNGDPVMVPMMETVITGYQGVNRVWNELDNPNSSASAAIAGLGTSITQGSGSCYVFYPQSIDDRNQCLKLLAAMQIVFFDENGTQLAKAYMDTEHPLEESGRILVPLQLYQNKDTVVDSNGEEHNYYITALERNQAKRITAMVYLDGTNLTNADVLAAGSITGQLNLQFGTTQVNMDAMDDSDLMDDYYSIRVTSNRNYEFAENLTQWNYPLKMTIVGMQPSTVRANFISVISSTQGARQQVFDIVKNEETGFYEANVSFAGPGNYQLRSVQIDGVDYPLKEIVYVTIPGESVSSLTWGDSTTGNSKTVLTAEGYYEQALSLSLHSNSTATVRAVFVGDNGSNVTVNFTTSDGVEYTGLASFNASGTYRLEYVYINNSPTPLDPELYKTIDISLGLRAQVTLSEPYVLAQTRSVNKTPVSQTDLVKDYSFTPGTGYYFVYNAAEPIFFDVRCKIFNDQGEEIMGLTDTDIVINYGQGKSATYPLSSELNWDSSAGCYTGIFEFQNFGIFEFQNVVINKVNYVAKATSAHRITSVSTDPMEYVPTEPKDIFFKLGATASERAMSLKLKNASAANLEITITNGTDTEVRSVTSAYTDAEGNSVFVVDGLDDGRWTITGVRASTVFYKAPGATEGKFYAGGTDPAEWLDLTTLPNWQGEMSTLFITKTTVTLHSDKDSYSYESMILEKDHVLPQGTLKLAITAYDGEPIAKYAAMANATVNVTARGNYKWNPNPNSCVASFSTTPGNILLTGSGDLSESSPRLELNAAVFTVDGVYKMDSLAITITVTVDEETYTKEENAIGVPSVTVTWTAPTVKVTGTTPGDENARYYVFPLSEGSYVEGDFTSFTDYYASVNLYYPYQEGWTDNEWNYPRCPSVELTMTGISANFKEATMVFANASSTAYSSEFKFTPTAGATSFANSAQIGAGFNRADDADAPLLYPAGSQTVGFIKVKDKNDVVYTVSLPNSVTINQPDKLIYATFASKSSDNVSLASTPGSLVAKINAKGEYVVTLPTINQWTVTDQTKLEVTYTQNGATVERTVHTRSADGISWSGVTYTYKKYTEYKKVMQGQGVQTDWDENRTLTGWKVGNKVYVPGETVVITDKTTFTPVIAVEKINVVTTNVSATYDKYEYSGVQGTQTKKTSTPSGYGTRVDSVSNYSTTPVVTPVS
ncbi:MAG: hypothetical protein IJX37_05690 [Oscillospiraceae bacterium]|nr:hypothetical protein [Oscillospiraceae bacterium]